MVTNIDEAFKSLRILRMEAETSEAYEAGVYLLNFLNDIKENLEKK